MVSILDIPLINLTPGMRQYQDAKKQNPDCIIMMRMGDFYELFYEDAETAATELEITLTARGKGEKRAPLAGIPYHALEGYLGRLVKKGHKVAIIEQLEDPKQAKGLVKRGLVRIVTPGTLIDSSMLQQNENNFLMALTINGQKYASAFCDLSTGQFFCTEHASRKALLDEVTRVAPAECVIPQSLQVDMELVSEVKMNCYLNFLEDFHFRSAPAEKLLREHFSSLEQFGLQDKPLAVSVAGGLLQYLLKTQQNSLTHIRKIEIANQEIMLLDSTTYLNLEVLKQRDGSTRGTLLEVLNKTVTAMGGRLLKSWLKSPLLDISRINARLNAVEEMLPVILREDVREILRQIYDLERLISRVNYGNAQAKDLLALKNSLIQIPFLKSKLASCQSPLLKEIATLPLLPKIVDLIEQAIADEGLIKPEFDSNLAALYDIKHNGKQYLANLAEKERKKTGIPTLKISYNRVFGYFIEVTKKNINLVPENYQRKQTTANGERYITEELKIEETKILGAEEKIKHLEQELFTKVVDEVALHTENVQEISIKIAVIDVICSLAATAQQQGYCRPGFTDDNMLKIVSGRHPVIELSEEQFITNDVILKDGEIMIITGPNMAGKSTVMRQTALIVLMAQIGSFVPAESCVLSITDKIFTRVGASDDLRAGRSTFMVEMHETANILHNATKHSLIIMDEIGRGTSTFDGVSIAWSVAEYICNSIKCKTLFATHYHILNKLASKLERVSNYNIAVRDVGHEIIFLRKLVPGGTDQSYGIHVAKLAGLPPSVVNRALEVQSMLEKEENMTRKLQVKKGQDQTNLGNFANLDKR